MCVLLSNLVSSALISRLLGIVFLSVKPSARQLDIVVAATISEYVTALTIRMINPRLRLQKHITFFQKSWAKPSFAQVNDCCWFRKQCNRMEPVVLKLP